MAVTLAVATQNAAANAIGALPDGGKIHIYSGTRPANPDTAVTATEKILASFTLPADAFGTASSGQITLLGTPYSTTGTTDAGTGTTATWFRMMNNAATPAPVIDGSVGTTGTDMTLNTASISSGVTVQLTGGTLTVPAS